MSLITVTKKHHALLLEVLIAFTLVVLCLFPLLHPHIHMLKATADFSQKSQLDKMVDIAFVEILEKLYKNDIPWETLTDERYHSHAMPQLQNMQKQALYKFSVKHRKKGKKEGQTHYLFELDIAIANANSSYSTSDIVKDKNTLHFPFDIYIERQILIGQDKIKQDDTRAKQQAAVPKQPKKQNP